jgi:hypothetical protein
MLDEAEYSIIRDLHTQAVRRGKASAVNLDRAAIDALFSPVLDAYERITGCRDVKIDAVMHHRLSLFGPPCNRCAKPLRTPRAAYCAACGSLR